MRYKEAALRPVKMGGGERKRPGDLSNRGVSLVCISSGFEPAIGFESG